MSDAIGKFLDKDLADDFVDAFFHITEEEAIEKIMTRHPEMCWKCMGNLTRVNNDQLHVHTLECDDCGWRVTYDDRKERVVAYDMEQKHD